MISRTVYMEVARKIESGEMDTVVAEMMASSDPMRYCMDLFFKLLQEQPADAHRVLAVG